MAIVIQTVILLSSSFVTYFAEQALDRGKIARSRLLWLMTSVMGSLFLLDSAKEWADNDFGLIMGTLFTIYPNRPANYRSNGG